MGELAETTSLLRMRRGNLTEGSNPSLSATITKPPKIGTFSTSKVLSSSKMDTFDRKMDTYNLYKNNDIYYFRTRIDNKLYRKSLKTSNLKKAIIRAKLIKSMKKEDLKAMFELKEKDLHLIFEYDNLEELKQVIEYATKLQEIRKQQENENKNTNIETSNSTPKYEKLTFEILQEEFIANKENLQKVTKSSIKQYVSSFNKLNLHFRNKDINKLDYKDFEEFREILVSQELDNKTINGIISYTKNFLDFALKRRLIEHNPCLALENLPKTQKQKENFTDEEVVAILQHVSRIPIPYIFPMFAIAAFTGMRIAEIIDIKKENILIENKTNIKYIYVDISKTNTGIRKIPLHPSIQNLDLSPLFAFNSEGDKNKLDKKVLKILYEVIPKGIGKTFHTFRGTFAQKLMNLAPDKPALIMDIVGHSNGKQQDLTFKTYGKEFYLSNKLELIEKVDYC